ncbi:hypothetical protein BDV93DRAFT_565985, partial [Ceratobasidium sp. AG-I]
MSTDHAFHASRPTSRTSMVVQQPLASIAPATVRLPSSRASSIRALSRAPSVSIHYDLQPPLAQPHAVMHDSVASPQNASPAGSHSYASETDLPRYTPFLPTAPHKVLAPEATAAYYSEPPVAVEYRHVMQDRAMMKYRRRLMDISRRLYNQPDPPEIYSHYLRQHEEQYFGGVFEALAHLCAFRPDTTVQRPDSIVVPTISYAANYRYYRLYSSLLNLHAECLADGSWGAPDFPVPVWPRLECSFDIKQFTAAAIFYRDRVSRFLSHVYACKHCEYHPPSASGSAESIRSPSTHAVPASHFAESPETERVTRRSRHTSKQTSRASVSSSVRFETPQSAHSTKPPTESVRSESVHSAHSLSDPWNAGEADETIRIVEVVQTPLVHSPALSMPGSYIRTPETDLVPVLIEPTIDPLTIAPLSEPATYSRSSPPHLSASSARTEPPSSEQRSSGRTTWEHRSTSRVAALAQYADIPTAVSSSSSQSASAGIPTEVPQELTPSGADRELSTYTPSHSPPARSYTPYPSRKSSEPNESGQEENPSEKADSDGRHYGPGFVPTPPP